MKEESSFTISPSERNQRREQLLNALHDKEYREAFARQQTEVHLPFQIKALRKAAGWSQKEFGERLGKPQSVVSRLERPDYGRFNINTLLQIAAVFDVGLLVTFVPFGTLLDRVSEFSVSDVSFPSFANDPTFKPDTEKTNNVQQLRVIEGGRRSKVDTPLEFFISETKTTPDAAPIKSVSVEAIIVGQAQAS